MTDYRIENDSMGTVRVPRDAHYGAQTQRAVENFAISGAGFPQPFLIALALIKGCAARVNADLGLLNASLADAVVRAAEEVRAGRLNDQFVVDLFQTGSGTSTNMNMNEVIASRANEMLTGKRGGKAPVHPNDHVNRGQSSNDVIPTAIHVATLTLMETRLTPALKRLRDALAERAGAFADVEKLGRTHLQDAVPMTLGQEFSGYARQIELGLERLAAATPRLCELALGGTAVGTGINTHAEFAPRTIARLADHTGLPFVEAVNHFSAQGAQDAAVEVSGDLKTIAVSLVKVANDIRWLASGPRSGLGEIVIPSLQPGSSIMPGKVNPVIPEMVLQVAAQVVGNDAAITMAGQWGNFELNVMLPLIARNLIESVSLLASAADAFAEKCIIGIEAHPGTCSGYIEKSLAMATGLVPEIGYDRAAALAKRAFETGKTVREVALEEAGMDARTLEGLLGPVPDA